MYDYYKYFQEEDDPFQEEEDDDDEQPIDELNKIITSRISSETEEWVNYWIDRVSNINKISTYMLIELYKMVGQNFLDTMIETYPMHGSRLARCLSINKIPFEITEKIFDVLYEYEDHYILISNDDFVPNDDQFVKILNTRENFPLSNEEYDDLYYFFRRNEECMRRHLCGEVFLELIIDVTNKRLFRYLIDELVLIGFPLVKLSKKIDKYVNDLLYQGYNIQNLGAFICNRILTIRTCYSYYHRIKDLKIALTQNIKGTWINYGVPKNSKLLDPRIPKSLIYQKPHLFMDIMQVDTPEKVLIKNWKLNFKRMLNYKNNLSDLLSIAI